jgi:2-hydroxychromene-2-carboxylate isomerase
MKLDFWFEFASTYSYPAAMRIEALAREANVALDWKPFLLGPIFARQSWDDSPFNIYPAKGRYMWRDLERICAGLGLPFRRPTVFPRSGLLAARIACIGAEAGAAWIGDFVRAVYHANFGLDWEIGDPNVIGEILDGLGLPAAALIEQAGAPAVRQMLRQRTAEAEALGLFGAPSFVADGELFWGNDRLEPTIAWAAERGLAARPPGD